MGRHGRDRKEQKRDQERAYGSMHTKESSVHQRIFFVVFSVRNFAKYLFFYHTINE